MPCQAHERSLIFIDQMFQVVSPQLGPGGVKFTLLCYPHFLCQNVKLELKH